LLKVIKDAQPLFSRIAKKNGNLVNWQTESLFAKQIIASSSLLQGCAPDSITAAIASVAAIGLSLNPKLQHCALIPRRDERQNLYLCHADPMYRGIIALGVMDEAIVQCRCEIVRQADYEQGNFHYQGGTTPSITFNPNPFETEARRGPIIGAFCITEIPGSKHPQVTLMSIEEIHKIRNRSELWKAKVKFERENPGKHRYGGPWESDEGEMCRKTVVKRASKYWPKGKHGRHLIAVDYANKAEGYVTPKDTDIEGESVKLVTKEQAQAIEEYATAKPAIKLERVTKRYRVQALAELPADQYDDVMAAIKEAKLMHTLKHATAEIEVFASDYGLTLEALTGKAADVQSKARLRSERGVT
jgi:recombinational DNA repair protein RecT